MKQQLLRGGGGRISSSPRPQTDPDPVATVGERLSACLFA
jgi:hypothetical protein